MKKASLNHCYKLIWNSILQSWVAVAEHVKSHGKQSNVVKRNINQPTLFALVNKAKLGLLLLCAFSSLGLSQAAIAQWEGVENKHGQASYEYNGQHLDVRVKSNRLIANARSLDIAKNESVRIHQLSAQDTALFRSIGSGATEIFGRLSANGKIFLVNQNGVLFGQGAQVNVGSIVATSMNITDINFLKGQYQFSANGNTNSVVNQGVIKVADGGYAVMLGQVVENTGSISANQGSVVLASAEHAVLDFYGNGLVKAKLSGGALQAVIEQSGSIQADGGAVQLATNSRSSAVNVSGIVQANTLVERNGVIRLEGGNNAQVGVSGTLSAKGEVNGTQGGEITVTGEQVALLDGATLDASGKAGGGTVLLGGDYQGKNKQVYNARTTYVDKGATIKVNAENNGDGGKAIVWADNTTRYYGNIEAKGGVQSGNGGFVEVSGKQQLDFIGGVDVGASYGQGGTVLLDPEFIVLNNSTQVAPPNNANGTPDIAYADAPAAGTTTIQINDVRGFSELFLQATKDITVANNLFMQTNNSIVFEAGRDINVNAGIRTYGTGSTNLTAANNINVNAEVRAHNTGNIDLTAGNHINVGARMYNFGTGYISLSADADTSGAGDVNINQRVFARQGNITISGQNISNTATGTMIQTQGLVGQDSGSVYLTANNAVNLAGNIVTAGRNSTAGLDGANAGLVSISAGGAITTNNISAYGGNGGTGNTAGGNAGSITLNSTGAGDINIGTLNSRNGLARGTGAGGLQGGISINNTNGDIATKNLYTHGNVNGDAGNINVTASAGAISVTGNVYAQGGTTAAGSTLPGGNGGNITMSASGDVAVSSRVYAQGGTPRNGNTAAGGNAGNVDISGENLNFNNVIYAYGGTGRGINQVGGNAGNISLNATGSINTKQVYAYGGAGGTGTGSNANGGDAGAITIASTGPGDINLTSTVNARSGAARGVGMGGDAGSINITNSNGDIATRNLDTYGNLNGHGGDINVAAATGDVTVTGRVYSYGGSVNNGHTLAGRDGGNITISGLNRTISSRINAGGNTAKGTDQAGGNAGLVSVTGSGALNVRDVYARNGRATGTGAGGNVGSITLSGSTVSASSSIVTSGERNGDAGTISITSTSGDTNLKNVYANGGSANTNTTGNNAGNITINAAGTLVTSNVYANGSAGNGINQDGGNGAVIDVDAVGAITTNALNASGGTGGNGTGSNANGGNAGAINIRSTAAGDININNNLAMHSGFARGNGNAGAAGSIMVKNDAGNINTRNIYAEGYNHGDGSNVTLDAEGAGNVTVTGQIRAYGDVNASSNRDGTDGGDVVIMGVNTTITNTINTSGGRGRGANQIGGNAGDITIGANGAVGTQALVANGGNAGAGTGSIAAGGDAGDINITSTGAGNITTAAITARTGYTRGSATATGAGSINLQNNNGAINTGNLSTRGQRRGVGGDITAETTGGNITTGIVDARASNLAATQGGDVTLATTTGDATVPNILTGGRWLVYSGDPRNDVIGGFKSTADFKQYNTNYGDALLDGGNGFVYRFAPMITTSLTGAVSKPYDGNTTASIAGLTLNQLGGEIDGDLINISALTSATYDNKEVGTGKTVTSNPLTAMSGSNGSTTVYGYQVNAATGNIGEITESALSIAEAEAALAAQSNPRNDAGLGALITSDASPQQFVAVFDVNATAAGGEGTDGGCQTAEDQSLHNPNTSLMLNFGMTLPDGVEQTCDE